MDTLELPPPNAKYYVHRQAGHYVSPPCLKELGLSPEDYRLTTEAELHRIWETDTAAGRRNDKERRVVPDSACRELGGFQQEGRSLRGKVLERLGILPRFQSRWDDEGNWRW
jgi:hypothetical protein